MKLKEPNPLRLLKKTDPRDYDDKMNSGFLGKKHPSFAFALVAGTYPVLLIAFIVLLEMHHHGKNIHEVAARVSQC